MKSQLDTLCEGLGITITSKYGAIEPKTDWQRKAHGYKCTLRYQRRTEH